jgi:hypothetical protein
MVLTSFGIFSRHLHLLASSFQWPSLRLEKREQVLVRFSGYNKVGNDHMKLFRIE